MEGLFTLITSIPKTNYANYPRLNRTTETKLVAVNSSNSVFDTLNHLDRYFDCNDVIVINDSAVLPGSFQGFHYPSNTPIEFRLVRFLGTKKTSFKKWQAIVYGQGSWLSPTEQRHEPPEICIGDLLITRDLMAKVINVSGSTKRLLTIEFQGPNQEIIHKIYYFGKMIQYSYLREELNIWDHQTIFSTYPVSIEPNSASFQLNWNLMERLLKKGVKIIPITHAISISNTGIEEIDERLPLDERCWLSERSADLLNLAIAENKNIVAFGTSVTRALESIMGQNKKFVPGTNNTDLVITKDYKLRVTDGILTGMHMINESHINLLQAFLPLDRLLQEYREAQSKTFLWHEYGDNMLIKRF